MPRTVIKRRRLVPRRKNNAVTNPQATVPIKVVSASAATNVATVTFDQVVSLNGTPAYTTDLPGVTATSVAQTAPTTIALTFSAAITSATALNIPYEEPSVRNSSGGFVSTSTFPV